MYMKYHIHWRGASKIEKKRMIFIIYFKYMNHLDTMYLEQTAPIFDLMYPVIHIFEHSKHI